MLSYQKIILESQTFANNHQQINSFGNGDLWETVQRDMLQAFNYPLLWMQDNGSTIQDKAIFFNFNVLAIDQVLNGEENENFVKSSMYQILLDYMAYFRHVILYDANGDRIKFDLQLTANLTSFTERFNDELTGWVMTVSFKTPFNYNKCNIPEIGN